MMRAFKNESPVPAELMPKVITLPPKTYNDIGKQHRQDPAILSGNALDAKQNDDAADRQHLMIEGYGAQPVPPPAANDNVQRYHVGGLVSPGDVKPIINTDYVLPRVQYEALMERGRDRGPFIQVYPDRKFYPFSPRPEEVFIESIAHGLSNICRYSGAGNRSYSVAEHSTLIARYLASRYAPEVALAGLLHDAPEALSGFGDVGRPVKDKAPIISATEDGIYRLAVAPRFGLPLDIPAEVHEADRRIIGDEVAANLAPMEWHARYDDPLGVWIRCWSAEKAEIEFLATFDALIGHVSGWNT
jgi:hypothetical protein